MKSVIFDRAMLELCSVHWKDAEFNTFEVHGIPIPSVSKVAEFGSSLRK